MKSSKSRNQSFTHRDSRIAGGEWEAQRTNPRGAAALGRRLLGMATGVVCLWLVTTVGSAQNYSIGWYKVSGGGGASTGGVYSVNGTLGQHDAGGSMTGGSFSVTGGFWSLIAPVQTPGAPNLYISHSGNTVTVSWQGTGSWTLQQNSSVTSPAGWSASSGVTTSGGTNYLNLTPPTGNLFFRLKNP